MRKSKLTVYVTGQSKSDLMRFAKESGITAGEIVERLLTDSGIAKRFFTPSRWGEMLAAPTIKEAITPLMDFESKVLVAKHRVSIWEREKKDLDKFISDTNKVIQEEIKEWKE